MISTSNNQVRVRFVTEKEQLKISDAPFVIPTRLTRTGLNQIVNELLNPHEQPKQFEYSIDNQLITSSLATFLSRNNISTEDIIVINYFLSASISECAISSELPSWIASLVSVPHQNHAIAGCYDGFVRIFDRASLSSIYEFKAHQEPIKAMQFWSVEGNAKSFLATASKDGSTHIHTYVAKESKLKGVECNLQYLASLVGSANSVETLCRTNQQLMVSGDWAGSICVYDLSSIYDSSSENSGDQEKSRHKRVKTSEKTHRGAFSSSIHPLFSLKGHHQCVSSIVCSDDKVISSSWDYSLKLWDLDKQDSLWSINTSRVVTSMDLLSHSLLSSHADGRLCVWDTRLEKNIGVAQVVLGAEKMGVWTAQANWLSDAIVSSIDYNGFLHLWDLRYNKKPIRAIEAHQGKAICMDYNVTKRSILSGGSDCQLRLTSVEV